LTVQERLLAFLDLRVDFLALLFIERLGVDEVLDAARRAVELAQLDRQRAAHVQITGRAIRMCAAEANSATRTGLPARPAPVVAGPPAENQGQERPDAVPHQRDDGHGNEEHQQSRANVEHGSPQVGDSGTSTPSMDVGALHDQ
jgi:hypothetical protein